MENKIRIFMVDDNREVVREVKEYFKNHAVISKGHAYDGEEALNQLILKENDYDLIVMDLIIPSMDGLSVLEELKKRRFIRKVL